VRFDEKARENLDAAERLLPDDSGVDALSNAAASRAYYAAYLAVADSAQRSHRSFTKSNPGYYRHDTLPEDAYEWRILDENGREDLGWLRDLRIKADYYEDNIDLDEASEAFDVARGLLERLLPEPSR